MVSVPSVALPSMKLIEPGDPAKSFLMRKLDGDACMFDAVCVNGSCGESMPQKSELIDPATRDAVRRWIHQGAKEN